MDLNKRTKNIEQFPAHILPYRFGKFKDTRESDRKGTQRVKDRLKENGIIDRHEIIKLTGLKNPADIIKELRKRHGMTIIPKREYLEKNKYRSWWELR